MSVTSEALGSKCLSLGSRLLAFSQGRLGGPILLVVLFSAALAVRLPNLLLVPRYIDEGVEVMWALDIAQGIRLPLTAVDAYYGPFFPYLIAGLFRVFGEGLLLPRLTTAIFGALTVTATYWLGRVMWDWRAGLIAGALALTNPVLVVTSHYGWSNSLVPFFFTVTAVCLYAGVSRQDGKLLALSGLLAAVTLQTHPLASVGLAGMLAWFLLRRDIGAWLRRRATWLALGLFLLGYSPMIVANLGFGRSMLSDALHRQYAFAPTILPVEYAMRLVGLLRHIYNIIGDAPLDTYGALLPIGVVSACLLAGGMVLAWRRGNSLPAAVLISTVVLLPVMVRVFVEATGDRYITFLVPHRTGSDRRGDSRGRAMVDGGSAAAEEHRSVTAAGTTPAFSAPHGDCGVRPGSGGIPAHGRGGSIR